MPCREAPGFNRGEHVTMSWDVSPRSTRRQRQGARAQAAFVDWNATSAYWLRP